MRLRRGAIVTAITCLASPALADALLPIGGAFGNEAGCNLFMTGAAEPGLILLTPDTLTTDAMGCTLIELQSESLTAFSLLASCTGHDAKDPEHLELTVTGSRNAGYTVLISGTPLPGGRLKLCPGTEDLFTPLGTQV